MLEIAIVYYLSKSIGDTASAKGRMRLGYQTLLWLFWFGGEFMGFVAGAVLAGGAGDHGDPPMLLIYGCALVGAIVGAVVVFAIVNSLPSLNSNDDFGRNLGRRSAGELPNFNSYGRSGAGEAGEKSLEERYKL